jgi:hypothetical protein
MAMNRNATVEQTQARQEKYGGTVRGMYLENFAAMGILPTPNAFDWNTPRKEETWEIAKARHFAKGVNLQNPLKQMASLGMLPTPAARDYKGANSIEHMENQNGNKVNHMGQLPNYIKYHSGNDSHQLNPQFVAEMMGFPTDWTELPFLSGDNNQ